MALSMYLHMLRRSAINPLIWRFSKHYFCEKNGKIDFPDKMCTARIRKHQYFFSRGILQSRQVKLTSQGSKLTEK